MSGGRTEGNCLTVVCAFFPERKHKGRFSNCLLWQKIIADYLQAGDWSQADPANLRGES